MTRRALAFIVLAVALGSACAPKVAPPKAAGVLRYPDFVYPAPPERVGDARARARLQEGWSRLQAGDLKGAESAFGQLVQQQPAFYPAAVGLGYALLAQSKPKEALARFDAASRTAPRYGPALAGRGEALLASGQRDAALEAFEAALAADAALGDLHRRIDALKLDQFQDRVAAATRASDAGRFDEARAAYAAAIALSPDTAFLYRDLGLVEARRKNLPEAERNLRKAVALDPADSKALTSLADVLEERGNVDGAIAALERAYALEPSDALKRRLDRLRERGRTSDLPPEYADIPRLPQATRGDVAALIGVRLQTVLSAAKPRPVRGRHRCSRALGLPVDRRGHPRGRDGRVPQPQLPAQGGCPTIRPGAGGQQDSGHDWRESEPGRPESCQHCGCRGQPPGLRGHLGGRRRRRPQPRWRELPPVARGDGAGGRRRDPPPRAARSPAAKREPVDICR